MAEIKLTQGKVALVDDEDFKFLNQWKWHATKIGNTYYAIRSTHYYKSNGSRSSRSILMHREILNASKGFDIDHINKDGLDNRRENIRVVTRRENLHNRINQADFIGSYKNTDERYKSDRYRAMIYKDGKQVYLGTFGTPQLAHEAYMNAYKSLTINNLKP